MKLSWRTEWPQWLLLAVMFALAAWAWPTAPDRVPTHWNIAGEVDGYSSKFWGLFGLPLVTSATYLLLAFIPRLDPGRANYAQFAGAYAALRTAILALLAAVQVMALLWMRGIQVDVGTVISVGMGALFIVLGNILGKIRPNWFVGIRTPWTLSSKTAWSKTHRLGGWAFFAAGVVMLLAGLLAPQRAFFVLIGAGFVASAVTVVYSYFAWRDATDKTPPANTLPGD